MLPRNPLFLNKNCDYPKILYSLAYLFETNCRIFSFRPFELLLIKPDTWRKHS